MITIATKQEKHSQKFCWFFRCSKLFSLLQTSNFPLKLWQTPDFLSHVTLLLCTAHSLVNFTCSLNHEELKLQLQLNFWGGQQRCRWGGWPLVVKLTVRVFNQPRWVGLTWGSSLDLWGGGVNYGGSTNLGSQETEEV